MNHYLLTRYNTGIYTNKKKTKGGKVIDPGKWMRERLKLFADYTVPSVENQSDKNFKWLICLDYRTPVDEYFAIRSVLGKASIIWGQNGRKAFVEYLKDNRKGPVITSRVDNDDALHRDYVAGLNDCWERKRKYGVFTYPSGLCYKPHKKEVRFVRHIPNHFLALIESGPEYVTCLHKGHISIVKYFKTRHLPGKHMWVEIVHYDNLANKMRGEKKEMKCLDKKIYGFSC